jgi:hypothetical protein
LRAKLTFAAVDAASCGSITSFSAQQNAGAAARNTAAAAKTATAEAATASAPTARKDFA